MDALFEQAGLDQLGTVGIVAVSVLVVVQLALQIAALIQLGKTPAERVSLGGRKWAWVLIILLGEIIGSVLWFAIGRTGEAAPTAPAADATRQRSAVDTLYGQPKGQ